MLANPGAAYGILMTGSYGDGIVRLDTRRHSGVYALTWVNLETGRPGKREKIIAADEVRLKVPVSGSRFGWMAALVKK